MGVFASLNINQCYKAVIEKPETDHALLAIIHSRVFIFKGITGQDVAGVLKIKPALVKRLFAFCRIIRDFHKIICICIKGIVQ